MASAASSLFQKLPLRFAETDIIEKIQVSAQHSGLRLTHNITPLRDLFFIKDKTYAQMEALLREGYKKECKDAKSPLSMTIPHEWTVENASKDSFNIAEKVQQWFMSHHDFVLGICFSDAPFVVLGEDPIISGEIQSMITEMRTNEVLRRQFIDKYREGTIETKERNLYVQHTIQKLQAAILSHFTENLGETPEIERFEIEVIYSENGERQRRISWEQLRQSEETKEEPQRKTAP